MATIVTSFTKPTIKALESELQTCLDVFAASRGLRIDVGHLGLTSGELVGDLIITINTQEAALSAAPLDMDIALAFVRRAEEINVNRRGGNLQAIKAEEDMLWSEIMDWQRTLPAGLRPGKLLNIEVEGGMAHYLVSVVTAKAASVEHLPLGDNLTSPLVNDSGTLTLKRAGELVRQQDKLCCKREAEPLALAARTIQVDPKTVGRRPFNKGSLKVKLRFGKLQGQVGSLQGETFVPGGEVLDAVIVEGGAQPSRECLVVTPELLAQATATQVGSDIIFVSGKVVYRLFDK